MAADAAPRAVVVFDGACVLCARGLRFLLRHDRGGVLRYAAMQGVAGRALLDAAALDADDPRSFLFVRDGAALTDGDAVLAVLSTLGGRWALLARGLGIAPRPLRDAAYRMVARSRYRWFGRRDACVVPEDGVRGRFLE